MTNRSPSDQSAHDQAVKNLADELDSEGWSVEADDVSGYDDPDTIGEGGTTRGRIPDIIATKRGSTRIIEIETGPEDDQAQHRVFKNHVRQKANRRLIIWLADSRGNLDRKLYDSAE
jgi:hypothetical protein